MIDTTQKCVQFISKSNICFKDIHIAVSIRLCI